MEYIFKSAFSLALLYSLFFVCLSRETFHRFNRMCLLLIMLLSLVLPLLHLTVGHPTPLNRALAESQAYLADAPLSVLSASTSVTWGTLLLGVYLCGVVLMLQFLLLQTLQLFSLLRGGLRLTDEYGNCIILHPGIRSPFSIFHWIVMDVDDYEHHRRSILAHEQEHIRLGHSYDLLFLEAMKVFQWFNPFIWFLGRDLCAIHEYEADEAVINQGIDVKQYQQLLVLKAVGNRLQPFANNLRRGSLKQRIIMMYQQKSNRWMMLKALFILPTVAMSLYAFATPESVPQMQDVLAKPVKTKTQGSIALNPDRIRVDSIAVPGQAQPDVFLLDGKEIPRDQIKMISTADIASVYVIKDDKPKEAYSRAQLGGRPVKGSIIIIHTKEYLSKLPPADTADAYIDAYLLEKAEK